MEGRKTEDEGMKKARKGGGTDGNGHLGTRKGKDMDRREGEIWRDGYEERKGKEKIARLGGG